MDEPKEIDEDDYFCTDEIVCPYCGCEFDDSLEYCKDCRGAEVDCQDCGKEFHVEPECSVTYTSSKTEDD